MICITVGQHVEGVIEPGTDSVNCELMMSKVLDKSITPEDRAKMMLLRNECAEFGIENGRITEEFLDEKSVYTTPGTTLRDGLTLCRQHAFLITHRDSVARYRENEADRLIALAEVVRRANPVEKQLAADRNLLAKEDERQRKLANTKAAKEAEKERRKGLTTEQKQAEKLAVRES